MLNMTATTWLKYQTEPTSATYHRTVPKPNTTVSPSRTRPVSANRPKTSQASPTPIPPKTQLAIWGGKSGPEDRHERDEQDGRQRRIGDVPDPVLGDQLVQPRRRLGQVDPAVEERVGEADEVVEVLPVARRGEQVDRDRDRDDDQRPERVGPAPDRVDQQGEAGSVEPVDDSVPRRCPGGAPASRRGGPSARRYTLGRWTRTVGSLKGPSSGAAGHLRGRVRCRRFATRSACSSRCGSSSACRDLPVVAGATLPGPVPLRARPQRLDDDPAAGRPGPGVPARRGLAALGRLLVHEDRDVRLRAGREQRQLLAALPAPDRARRAAAARCDGARRAGRRRVRLRRRDDRAPAAGGASTSTTRSP